GAYGLIVVGAVSFVLLLYWAGLLRWIRVWMLRALCVVAVAAAAVVMLYTGLLLSSMPSVPAWNTFGIPVLFALSSLSCGLSAVMLSAALSGGQAAFAETLRRLMKCDIATIAAEAVALAAYAFACVGMLTQSDSATAVAGAASAARLLAGDLSLGLWGGFALCGLAVPAVLETAALRSAAIGSALGRAEGASASVMLVVSALVLVGACIMRYCVVQAGMHPSVL
ncbi:MAG: polysulfide reductase NrfD, partial [Eggerthellaceae bacterium]|nr:polysulfide reductase NrfD [Eggerthellaceae bacterium]